MELSSVGTLSTLTIDGWPLGVGVRFAVDQDGTSVLRLNRTFSPDKRSALHVQLEQCGLRTPQCTIQGSISRPGDDTVLKNLTRWGGALLELAQFHSVSDSKQMIQDAITKLEEALLIDPKKHDAAWCIGTSSRNKI